MLRPSHFRTPRTINEACFTDCSYQTPTERRVAAGLDVLVAVLLGLAGAAVLFFGLSS